MIDISRHIEYLLLEHDSVNVPQLGLFQTIYESSKWCKEENLLLPPYRSVFFQQDENCNGELFISSLASRLKSSRTEVLLKYTEYIDNVKQELKENGAVELGGIGTLVYENKEIILLPCQAGVASPSLYGLDAICQPMLECSTIGTTEKNNEARLTSVHTDGNNITISINRNIFNYAAAILIAVCAFFSFSQPTVNTNYGKPEMAEVKYFMPYHLQSSSTITEKKSEIKIEESVNNNIEEETEIVDVNDSEEYAIVLASMVSQNNANDYIKNLNSRGYNAEVRTFSNMRRVIISGFKTREEAQNKIQEMRNNNAKEFKSIWTLKL